MIELPARLEYGESKRNDIQYWRFYISYFLISCTTKTVLCYGKKAVYWLLNHNGTNIFYLNAIKLWTKPSLKIKIQKKIVCFIEQTERIEIRVNSSWFHQLKNAIFSSKLNIQNHKTITNWLKLLTVQILFNFFL